MESGIQIVFGLLGGLALFIFGMNMMSECLQKAAGERMKSILALLTRNPIMGVLAGALTTAVLQSSSATTVMAIGFVSAGLMDLRQAIPIILGANIGTTITAQIIAFKISDYIYIIIFVGFILSYAFKNTQVKNIGQTIFAFGLLFLGIETMGDVMKPLASSQVFTDMIEQVADVPVLGVLVGTLMTLVVQSSSATIAVLQNFASQAGPDGVTSVLGLAGAIPILLGDNIGTTITAILASIGQSKDAKRTALAHCIFNISGALLFIWFVGPFSEFIAWISPKGPEIDVISRQIANAHTVFNVTMTLIWIPLIGLMVKLVMWIIPDEPRKKAAQQVPPSYLDQKMIGQPAAALQLLVREIDNYSDLIREMLKQTAKGTRAGQKEKLDPVLEKAGQAQAQYDQITGYLTDMFSAGVLTGEQAEQTTSLLYVLEDIDRMGDSCADVALLLQEKIENNYQYSKDDMKDIEQSLHMIEDMFGDILTMVEDGGEERRQEVMDERSRLMELDMDMRRAHAKRVAKGKCSADLTPSFNKILYSVERMSDSCVNIADATLEGGGVRYLV